MSSTAFIEEQAGAGASREAARNHTILGLGFAKWWGSDARALGQALRRLGHNVLDLDEEDYVSWRWHGVAPKILRRLFGRVWVDDYNRMVLRQAASSEYDFVLAFKGNLLKPQTVHRLRESGKGVYNFYPDVSFLDHGPNIPASLGLYDCVFTTKSYHGEREINQFGLRDLKHLRHGFDPEVHRPITLSEAQARHYGCDVSFVGCWSPEKEQRILHLLKQARGLSVRVFGSGWNYAGKEFRQRMGSNLRAGVFGDELAIVYRASKVNLGLLSYGASDATLRDQTTARTFQIPATGSFMLHEDTAEVRSLFRAGEEVMLFTTNDDMVEQINMALNDGDLRKAISERGYERSIREPYDYSSAAVSIVEYYEARVKASP
jgi:glycosyltransferase involved in cell wall biosynthesis